MTGARRRETRKKDRRRETAHLRMHFAPSRLRCGSHTAGVIRVLLRLKDGELAAFQRMQHSQGGLWPLVLGGQGKQTGDRILILGHRSFVFGHLLFVSSKCPVRYPGTNVLVCYAFYTVFDQRCMPVDDEA